MIEITVTQHQPATKIMQRSGSKYQKTLNPPKLNKIPTINQREMILERRGEVRRRTRGKEALLVLQFCIEMGHAARLTSIQLQSRRSPIRKHQSNHYLLYGQGISRRDRATSQQQREGQLPDKSKLRRGE